MQLDTMTRSVPLMTKEPVVVMSEFRHVDLLLLYFLIFSVDASRSRMIRRTLARSGLAKVRRVAGIP